MATPTKKRKRDLELETLKRRNMELAAQLAHIYHFATAQLDKAGKKHLMASGVLVQLHAIGGRQICPPFVIKNGLSDATIASLKDDAVESYELAIELKP